MTAKETLEGALYHLNRMKLTYLTKDFVHELRAFLSVTRSVPEHLLEDYNVKYSLNIPDEEHLITTFKTEAKRLNNKVALNFFNWWKAERDKLRNDRIGSLLFTKRNISIHRRMVKPDLAKVEIRDYVHVTDSVTVEKYDSEGKLIEIVSSPPERPKTLAKESESKAEWFFKEYPDENVLIVCQKLYEMMRSFVTSAESRF